MSDWAFMAGIVLALTVTLSLGVNRQRERNPQRPRRR